MNDLNVLAPILKDDLIRYLFLGLSALLLLIIVFLIVSFSIGYYIFSLFHNPEFLSRTKSKNYLTYKQREIMANEEYGEWIKTSVKFEEKSIIISDYYRSFGYFFEQLKPTNQWVILSHGYNRNHFSMYDITKKLFERGFNVLVLDLHAHGKSEGRYSSLGYKEHLEIIRWTFQILRLNPKAKIALFGQSMGAHASIRCGGEVLEKAVKCIISDSAYLELTPTLKLHLKQKELRFPSFPFLLTSSWWAKGKLDAYYKDVSLFKSISKNTLPVLLIQGSKDESIPVNSATEIFRLLKSPKEILIIEGASHIKCHSHNPELYYHTVFTFLEKYLN